MNGLRRLVFKPFDRIVDIALNVSHQQMRVGRFDRRGSNSPIRLSAACANRVAHNRQHGTIEQHLWVRLSLFGHSLAHWIAIVEHVRLDITKLFIPSIGPMPALIARQP